MSLCFGEFGTPDAGEDPCLNDEELARRLDELAAHQLPEMLVVLRGRASAAQRSEAANPEGVTRAKRGIAAFMLCPGAALMHPRSPVHFCFVAFLFFELWFPVANRLCSIVFDF